MDTSLIKLKRVDIIKNSKIYLDRIINEINLNNITINNITINNNYNTKIKTIIFNEPSYKADFKELLEKYEVFYPDFPELPKLSTIGYHDQSLRKSREKSLYLIKDLENYINEGNHTNNEIENKKNEVLKSILENRRTGLKKCKNIIKNPNHKKYVEEEFNKEESRKNNNIENQLQQIIFGPNNSKYNQNECNIDTSKFNSEYLYEEYIKKQYGKIFLLGSSDNMKKYETCKNHFFINPALDSLDNDSRNKCDSLVEWTMYLNMLYLLVIKYSKLDISGMIVIPKNKQFTKKRRDTEPSTIKGKFIGFIVIPYENDNDKINKFSKSFMLNELLIAVFETKEKTFSFAHSTTSHYTLYDLNSGIISHGHIYRDFTILYYEIIALFKYLGVKGYYDINLPYNIFLSNLSYEDITIKYPNLKEVFLNENSFNEKIYNKKHYKKKQISLYFKNMNTNHVILKSIEKNNTEFMQEGGNILFNIDKIINKHRSIVNKFFNKNYENETKFYSNIYNEYKYVYNYPFLHESKYYTLDKKINWKNLLSDEIKGSIYKYEPLTFGYHYLYQLYKDDYEYFNTDNIKIAEISVLPTFFEILKKNNKNNSIDLYLTENNYRSLDDKLWKDLIKIYKLKIGGNIFYNKKISKKYNILIINLIKDIEDFSNDYNNNYTNYTENTIEKYIKDEIKNLKYLEKGGTCYIFFYSIFSNNLLELYLKLCKKFENIDFFIGKYRENYKIYGGLWLKCYNYKTKNKLSSKELIRKLEIFYKNYYDKKYEWYLDYEKFIENYFEKNSSKKNFIQTKYNLLENQINTAKNFAEEYQLEIKPEWKKFIYGDFYINQIYKDINYRTKSSNEFNEIFRILPNNYNYLPYGILDKKNINCHDGQRKLLFSEIEFYTLVSQKYDLKNILVVYAGSGEGIHEQVIFNLFPELDFYFCDPIKFLFKHPLLYNKDRVRINNNYYTDETWKDVFKFNKKNKNIIFISDIRGDVTEKDIMNNMIQQQKWTIQLNSVAYMLKFRLPYLDENFNKSLITYKLPKEVEVDRSYNNMDNEINKKYDFYYLKGSIYIQLYSPTLSSETRLVYVRDKNEKFIIQKYNIENYDGNMYYFNQIDRSKKYKYKDSNLMKYHILGYDDSYESVSEYYIIDKYFNEKETSSNIIKKLYNINNQIIKYSNKDIVLCPFYTLFKKKKEFVFNSNKTKKNIAIDLLNLIKNIYIIFIFSLKNQYLYFGKGNILNYIEYENQRQEIKNKFKLLNKYIHDFINKDIIKKNVKYLVIKDILNKSESIFNKLLKDYNNENNENNINNKYLNIYNKLYKNL